MTIAANDEANLTRSFAGLRVLDFSTTIAGPHGASRWRRNRAERSPAPPAVIQTMEMVWEDKIAKSEAIQKYAAERSAIFSPIYGKEAYDGAMKMVRQTAWLYYDAGKAKVSPDTVGIPRK